MTPESITEMYAYDRWATSKVVGSLEALSQDEYMKDLRSSHGGIHGTLVHLLAADGLWLDRWTGADSPIFPRAADFDGLPAVQKAITAVQQRTAIFVEELTDERLAGQFTYRDSKKNAYSETLWYSMMHKVNHSTYHRGQIVTMIRQLDKIPVGTDLVTWRRIITKEG